MQGFTEFFPKRRKHGTISTALFRFERVGTPHLPPPGGKQAKSIADFAARRRQINLNRKFRRHVRRNLLFARSACRSRPVGGKARSAAKPPQTSDSVTCLNYSESSSSIHVCTGTMSNSVSVRRITTSSMPALMIMRRHMGQLVASCSSSPLRASRPTK